MNFNEIGNNGLVEGYAVIKQCDKKTAKNGNFYLTEDIPERLLPIYRRYKAASYYTSTHFNEE